MANTIDDVEGLLQQIISGERAVDDLDEEEVIQMRNRLNPYGQAVTLDNDDGVVFVVVLTRFGVTNFRPRSPTTPPPLLLVFPFPGPPILPNPAPPNDNRFPPDSRRLPPPVVPPLYTNFFFFVFSIPPPPPRVVVFSRDDDLLLLWPLLIPSLLFELVLAFVVVAVAVVTCTAGVDAATPVPVIAEEEDSFFRSKIISSSSFVHSLLADTDLALLGVLATSKEDLVLVDAC